MMNKYSFIRAGLLMQRRDRAQFNRNAVRIGIGGSGLDRLFYNHLYPYWVGFRVGVLLNHYGQKAYRHGMKNAHAVRERKIERAARKFAKFSAMSYEDARYTLDNLVKSGWRSFE